MATKKIPDSVVRAFLKRHRITTVSTVIEDINTVRVDLATVARRTLPWERRARRKQTGEQSS